MYKKLLATSLLVVSPFAAADFSNSAYATYLSSSIESPYSKIDTTGYLLGYSHYFDSVSTLKGPYQVATLLDPTSSVSVHYANLEFDSGAWNSTNDQYGAALHYVLDNGLFMDVNAMHIETGSGQTSNPVVLSVGAYLFDSAKLTISTEVAETSADSFLLSYEHFIAMDSIAGLSFKAAVGSTIDELDDDSTFDVGIDAHLTKALTLGVSYDSGPELYTVTGSYFFTPSLAVDFSMALNEHDLYDDYEAYSIGLTGRF